MDQMEMTEKGQDMDMKRTNGWKNWKQQFMNSNLMRNKYLQPIILIMEIFCIVAICLIGWKMSNKFGIMEKEMDGMNKENGGFSTDLNGIKQRMDLKEEEIASLKEENEELNGKMLEMEKRIEQIAITKQNNRTQWTKYDWNVYKWDETDCGPRLEISGGGFIVKHSGSTSGRNCVRATSPIPALNLAAINASIAFYFEVKILKQKDSASASIEIGFCEQEFPLEDKWLGEIENSIGIDQKGRIWIIGIEIKFENGYEWFKNGDVIGIGIIHLPNTKMECFATYYGELLAFYNLKMELYIFRHEQWERLYNCARINVDDIPLTERYHPLNGTIIIGMFIIFEALYLPCMFSIYKHSEHSSYKFLFYIGVIDMLMLFIHGLESGIFNFTGYMFCSNPHFIFFTASLAAGLFAMQTSGNFILALDRCTDLVSTKHSELFFSGNKSWFWMGASAIFSFYWMCFVNPGLYNGLYMNWFMNPYEGYPIKIDFNDYIHPISTYYNIFMTFAFPAIYILFIIMFLYRRSSIKAIANVRQRNWQIAMFIQVALITGMNISSFTLFAVMQHFSINKVAILVEYYVNYFVFGFPPLIFLCCNKTIRMDTRKLFGQIFFKMAIKMYKPSTTIIPNNLQSTAANWNAVQSNNISVSRSNRMIVNNVGGLVRQQRCQ